MKIDAIYFIPDEILCLLFDFLQRLLPAFHSWIQALFSEIETASALSSNTVGARSSDRAAS